VGLLLQADYALHVQHRKDGKEGLPANLVSLGTSRPRAGSCLQQLLQELLCVLAVNLGI
jgi:hypothetical protein